ncbi:hypothetical protein HDU93_006066 [Gonapodya sp. JEL0774]|nr:hypothetical protein HDU93_006066 [Gonapodya sp. JEL0774]
MAPISATEIASRLPTLLSGARLSIPTSGSHIPFAVSSVTSSPHLAPDAYETALRSVRAGVSAGVVEALQHVTGAGPYSAVPQAVKMILSPESKAADDLSETAFAALRNPDTWQAPLVEVVRQRLDEALEGVVKEVPRLLDGVQVAVEAVGRQLVSVTILCVCTVYLVRFIFDLPISHRARSTLACSVAGGMAGAAMACAAAVVGRWV